MTNVYLLVPYNWEYNDEYYYTDGNADISAAFATQELAEAARWEAERVALATSDDISRYGGEGLYGILSNQYDLDNLEPINARLKADGLEPIEGPDDSYSLPLNLTVEQAKEILSIFPGLTSYSIEEMEIQNA